MKVRVKYLLLIIGLIIVVLVVQKLYLAPSPQKPPNILSESPKPIQLELGYPYEVKNLTNQEKEEVLKLVKTFETLQYERRAKEVLELFTPATVKDDKDQLDFLGGKDLNSNPRLYSTAEFNCYLNWFMVRRMSKQDSKIIVELRELRTAYLNDITDYKATTKDLIMEVSKSYAGSYKIEKYYYKGDGATSELKYGSFACTL